MVSQSSIPVRIDLDVKVSYNRNSSLSKVIGFIDMATVAKRLKKLENTAFVSLVKWI